MTLISIDKTYRSPKSTVVALGNFDGVHIGHAALLRAAARKALACGGWPTALTFDPDPANVVGGGCISPILTDNEEKAYQMELLGIEGLFIKAFDQSVMRMTPEEFVERVLVRQLGCVCAVCGFHYRFGYKGDGDARRLEALCGAFGVETLILEPVMADNRLVSASAIRALLSEGRMREAAVLLGRPYSVNFPVVTGKRLGRILGFPTINQNFPDCHIVPKRGIYASRALVGGQWLEAVSNVGSRPTVERAGGVNMETHIVGCDDELYGRRVRVELHSYLREERKFGDIEALRRAIKADVDKAKAYFLKV